MLKLKLVSEKGCLSYHTLNENRSHAVPRFECGLGWFHALTVSRYARVTPCIMATSGHTRVKKKETRYEHLQGVTVAGSQCSTFSQTRITPMLALTTACCWFRVLLFSVYLSVILSLVFFFLS